MKKAKKRLQLSPVILIYVLTITASALFLSGCGKDGGSTDQGITETMVSMEYDDGDESNLFESLFQSTEQESTKEPELVTEETDFASEIARPANGFQDIRHWSYGDATALEVPDMDDDFADVEYYVSRETVNAYVQMLTENGFTLVDAYEFSYKGETFLSWALLCDAMPNARTAGSQYEYVDCHLNIWSAEDDEYHVVFTTELVMCDMGLRIDGGTIDFTPQGPSAGTGLYRLADGSYQTSDGRLTAKTGTAMVIRDGETLICDARYELDGNAEHVWIDDYYDVEGIYLQTELGTITQGEVLQIADVERRYKEYKTDDKYDITKYNWDLPLFLMKYNDGWCGPKLTSSDFEALTIRVMYYEENGDAVYYIYAKLKEAVPTEVEALCAVSTIPVEEPPEEEKEIAGVYESDDSITMSVGETITLKDDRHKFGSDYHVYEWKIAEGELLIDIDSVGNECTITAKESGDVVITVEYSYTEDSTDVLTGNPRVAHRNRTDTFNITIK